MKRSDRRSFGVELWQSDSTAGNTMPIADLATPGSSYPREPTVFGGRLFFVADSTTDGTEVFVLTPPSVPAIDAARRGVLVAMLGLLGLVWARSATRASRSRHLPARAPWS